MDEEDPRLQGIDPKIIKLISNEIMHTGTPVQWDDIAGRLTSLWPDVPGVLISHARAHGVVTFALIL